ncbi:hypothetical protein [Halobacillus campisalis]|uniref:Uncharacterized protein n=1 Tax=Halobacillus campisalis TaxID=435909 RepID=A0ABW2K6K4_9BACI|nr:hypothetical protein [Halobacillus campisalis]
MGEILLEYGTSEDQWGILTLSLFVILVGIAMVIAISKGVLKLPVNKKDKFIYVVWGFILLGGVGAVITLFNTSINETKNNNAIKGWTSERGYYVENYGEIKERKGEESIIVGTNSKEEEKEVDHVINGCDFDVYAELTNGDVWICIE